MCSNPLIVLEKGVFIVRIFNFNQLIDFCDLEQQINNLLKLIQLMIYFSMK